MPNDFIEITNNAILSPGPLVTLLSFSVALSLYLRSLYSSALDKMEELLIGESHKGYPHREKFTADMLGHLQATTITVEKFSPALFGFIGLLCLRLLLVAAETLLPRISPHVGQGFDVLLLSALIFGMGMMFFSHKRLVREHRDIRKRAREYHSHRRSEVVPGMPDELIATS